MVQTNLNLSMNNPEVVQIHAKQGDSGRLYKINLKDATEENGTLRILRPDGVEVTADAIKSASGDAYKGDLVTFDALEEVPLTKAEVTLESSQDLHGLPSPYPPNGSANKWDEEWEQGGISASTGATEIFSSRIRSKNYIPVTAGNVYSFVYQGSTINANGLVVVFYDSSKTYVSGAWRSNQFTPFTVPSGCSYMKFCTGDAYGGTYKNDIAINYPSTVTTYSPYSNICPIVASNDNEEQAIYVYQKGKNLLPSGTFPSYTYSWYSHPNFSDAISPVFLKAGVTYVLSGVREESYNTWFFLVRVFDAKTKQYTTDLSLISGGMGDKAYTVNGQATYFQPQGSGSSALYQTITPSIDCYIDVCVKSGAGSATNAQIEVGSTPTPYEAYQQGNTYSQPLGRAVYGGTLDVVSGKLTVTHAMYTFSGDEAWTLQSGSYGGIKYYSTSYLVRDSAKLPADNSKSVPIITSIGSFDYSYNQLHTHPYAMCIAADGRVGIEGNLYNPNGDTLEGVQMVYELATPIEVDLTPTQITTLLGENNIWSSGEVEVAFEYDGVLAELPQQATAVVGRCIGDVNFTNVSTMPFTLNVIPNNQEETP